MWHANTYNARLFVQVPTLWIITAARFRRRCQRRHAKRCLRRHRARTDPHYISDVMSSARPPATTGRQASNTPQAESDRQGLAPASRHAAPVGKLMQCATLNSSWCTRKALASSKSRGKTSACRRFFRQHSSARARADDICDVRSEYGAKAWSCSVRISVDPPDCSMQNTTVKKTVQTAIVVHRFRLSGEEALKERSKAWFQFTKVLARKTKANTFIKI